jgi:hypothetical protein
MECSIERTAWRRIRLFRWQNFIEAKGRIHIVVNYGIGLHLGVCMFKETDENESAT